MLLSVSKVRSKTAILDCNERHGMVAKAEVGRASGMNDDRHIQRVYSHGFTPWYAPGNVKERSEANFQGAMGEGSRSPGNNIVTYQKAKPLMLSPPISKERFS